jgi:hypothetical protein
MSFCVHAIFARVKASQDISLAGIEPIRPSGYLMSSLSWPSPLRRHGRAKVEGASSRWITRSENN